MPTYDELVIVARREDLDARAARGCAASCARSAQGHAALRADPAAGVDALLKANPDLDRDLQLDERQGDAAGLLPGRRGKPFGWQEPAEWERLRRLDVRATSCSSRPPDAARALTNEFLPGPGAGRRRARG